jgi:hypothetical protein
VDEEPVDGADARLAGRGHRGQMQDLDPGQTLR